MNATNCERTHAPSHLREQFQEWLDSYEPNRLKELDIRPVASLLDALADCGDIRPAGYCDQLEIPKGSTYAEAVGDVREWYAKMHAPEIDVPDSNGESICNRPENVQLIERLGFVPNDERAARVVASGVESGFPLCCVLFFASIWCKSVLLPNNDLDELVTGDYRRLLARARIQGKVKAGYVPCPACLLAVIR